MKRRWIQGLLLLGVLAAVASGLLLSRPPPEPAPLPDRAEPPRTTPDVPHPEDPLEKLRRELERLRRGGKTVVKWRAGSAAELAHYRAWVDAESLLALGRTAPAAAAPPGFRALALPGLGQLLAEEPDQRRGAGALVLRHGDARPWVIEVPHSFFDEGTLELGLRAFELGNARALLVNTVHRHRALAPLPADVADTVTDSDNPKDKDRDKERDDDEDDPAAAGSGSDVAHAEESFFLEAHRACVDALGAAWVLQLHGFADRSARVDAVVSAARTSADPVPLARALERALGIRAAAYPTELGRLGGTRNRQARDSASRGKPFIHLELSRSLRQRLSDDPEFSRRFVAALTEQAP